MDVRDVFLAPVRRIRVPDGHSVALPGPFARLVDHPDVQRLRRVRQLSQTHLVYPGAVDTRFEHSLGVFWAAVAYLESLTTGPEGVGRFTAEDLGALLAAALLHDIGHYPFAHSLEALHSQAFRAPRHEALAAAILDGHPATRRAGAPTLGDVIEDGLGVPRERVAALVQYGGGPELSEVDRLLGSVIHSAIDADKLDYLERDSVHLGVPYGRMPDRERLLTSLTVTGDGTSVALREKGRVSGEIFLFSRYLMFSEAYWHHTSRAASAMVEAALADYVARARPSEEALEALLLTRSDDELLQAVAESGDERTLSRRLLERLTTNARGLYKRVLTLNRQRDTELCRAYDVVYGMERGDVQALTDRLRARLEPLAGVAVAPGDVLIDTPPRDKDRMDSIRIVFETASGREELPLEEVSTVVRGVALDFVKVVKRIRVFVAPELRERVRSRAALVESALLDEILA
jgi:uncharacterized protein